MIVMGMARAARLKKMLRFFLKSIGANRRITFNFWENGASVQARTADYLVVFPLHPVNLSFELDDQPCSFVFNVHPLLRALDTAQEDDSLYLVLEKGKHCLIFENDQRLRRFKWKNSKATEFKATALAEWNNRARVWIDTTNFVCVLDYYFNMIIDLLHPRPRIMVSASPWHVQLSLQGKHKVNLSGDFQSEGIGLFNFPRTARFGISYLKSVMDFILQTDGVILLFSEEPYTDSILCEIEGIGEIMFYAME